MESRHIALTPALVVEDDPAMQRRLAQVLAGIQEGDAVRIVTAGNLAEAHRALASQTFAIALIDVGLPDGNGVDLVAWLREHRPQLPALVISAWGHEDTVLAALRAGAVGYLLKERDDLELTVSLRSVQRGGAPIDPAIAKRILAHLAAPPEAPPALEAAVQLSERETEILRLVARGYTNREIAEMVSLSRLTIEGYTKAIYRKLAVGSRTAAVYEAQHLGLLQ